MSEYKLQFSLSSGRPISYHDQSFYFVSMSAVADPGFAQDRGQRGKETPEADGTPLSFDGPSVRLRVASGAASNSPTESPTAPAQNNNLVLSTISTRTKALIGTLTLFRGYGEPVNLFQSPVRVLNPRIPGTAGKSPRTTPLSAPVVAAGAAHWSPDARQMRPDIRPSRRRAARLFTADHVIPAGGGPCKWPADAEHRPPISTG